MPNENVLEAVLRVTGKGIGFANHPETDETIVVHEENLNTAMNGDTVELTLLFHDKAKNEWRAEVARVLIRRTMRFAGILDVEKGRAWVKVDGRRMYTDIHLPDPLPREAINGYKVLVVITKWDDPEKSPEGRLIRVLGPAGDHETEMRAITEAAGFAAELPPDILEEAALIAKTALPIPASEIAKRRDMRDVLTFTIDPIDAKDFDDAISFRDLNNGTYEIGIHIADVSHYVRPGGAIDREARDRATSVYMVDRTIPMLPEILSNNICSLVPNEDRLTFAAIFTIDKHAKILDEWYGRTVIHSDKRFTYETAQEIIVGNVKDDTYSTVLTTLNEIAKILKKGRVRDGAISFELNNELKFELSDKGVPLSIHKKERFDAHKLVEEYMLLANRSVARYGAKEEQKKPDRSFFVFRNHDLPDHETIDRLGVFLRSFGYKLSSSEKKVDPHALNAVINKAEGTEMEHLICVSMLRSMAKAVYSTRNIGHYGLALSHYTNFTSPIRRYPDVMVHRLMETYLDGGLPPEGARSEYEKQCQHSGLREREAMEAERDSIKYKQVEFMQGHIGRTYWALITGVNDYGFFAEAVDTYCEGFVPIRTLGNDYFEHDRKNYCIIGRRSKKRFRIGDKVKIKVVSANVEARQIDYELVS